MKSPAGTNNVVVNSTRSYTKNERRFRSGRRSDERLGKIVLGGSISRIDGKLKKRTNGFKNGLRGRSRNWTRRRRKRSMTSSIETVLTSTSHSSG